MDETVLIAIVEVSALIFARMRMSVEGLDEDATFTEGYELPPEHAQRVPRRYIGKILSRERAAALLDQLQRREKQAPRQTARRR